MPPRPTPRAAKALAEAARIERGLHDGPDAIASDDGLRLLSSRSALVVMHGEVVAGRAHPDWRQARDPGDADDLPIAPIPAGRDSPPAVAEPDREHATESL